MFADDTKVAQKVSNESEAKDFQATIDRLYAWSQRWGMSFNIEKCHIMHLGTNNIKYQYTMNGTPLSESNQERDIGVMISKDLKPAAQCKKAAKTATRVLNQILRAFHYRDKRTFLNLYKTYVRPHLEFAVAAWCPWNQADIELLENVQARAVKNVSGMGGMTYEERLQTLNLPTLADQRREIDLIQVYKIVRNVDDVSSSTWFKMAEDRRPTRATAGAYPLLAGRSHHEYRRHFFSQRVIQPWNSLPDEIKQAPNPSAFKRQYRRQRHMEAPARYES